METTTTSSTGSAPAGGSDQEAPSGVGRGAQAVQEHGGAALNTTKEQASEVARSAAEHARTVLDSATGEVREQARTRATELSGTLEQVSGELRAFADHSSGSTMLADVARTLADASQRASRRLKDAGPEGVVQDVARYGRQYPGRFVAIAAASGFAAGRLLRSADTSTMKDALTGSGSSSSDDPSGSSTVPDEFLMPNTSPTLTGSGTSAPIELPPDAVVGLVEGGGPIGQVP